MTSKHTPGPWSIDRGSRNQQFIRSAFGKGYGYIARVHPIAGGVAYRDGDAQEVPSEEAKANARLLAAAPNLMAAMKRISVMVDSEKQRNLALIAIAQVDE